MVVLLFFFYCRHPGDTYLRGSTGRFPFPRLGSLAVHGRLAQLLQVTVTVPTIPTILKLYIPFFSFMLKSLQVTLHIILLTSVDCYEHFTQKKKISDQAEKLIEAHHFDGCKLQNDTNTKLCKNLTQPILLCE